MPEILMDEAVRADIALASESVVRYDEDKQGVFVELTLKNMEIGENYMFWLGDNAYVAQKVTEDDVSFFEVEKVRVERARVYGQQYV